MANVKTAISLQETLFNQAEALAQDLNVSRSRLFSLAIKEFIQRYENQKLLEAINAAYDESAPEPEEQQLLEHMRSEQRRLVEEEPW